jgi:hypothetical protein
LIEGEPRDRWFSVTLGRLAGSLAAAAPIVGAPIVATGNYSVVASVGAVIAVGRVTVAGVVASVGAIVASSLVTIAGIVATVGAVVATCLVVVSIRIVDSLDVVAVLLASIVIAIVYVDGLRVSYPRTVAGKS